MKKLISVATALSMLLCGVGSYSASADNYYGYNEVIFGNGYIVNVLNDNLTLDFDYFSVDNSKENYRLMSVELVEEEMVNNNCYLDEKFGGYQESEENTGFYYVNVGKSYDEMMEYSDIEVVYSVYTVSRNALIYINGVYGSSASLTDYKKIFKPEDLLENDANNDGQVNSEDALKVLNAAVGNETLTIEEKIQLGVMQSCNFVDYETADNLTSEKALEILQQVVGLSE